MYYRKVLLSLCCCRLIGVFGETLSVMEGDSVQLNLTGINKDDYIKWKFGAEMIAKFNMWSQEFSTFNGTDGRFRNKLKLDNQTGSLTITNITTEHTGDYQLEISGGQSTLKNFTVSVYARLPVPVLIRNSSQCSSLCSVLCSVVNVSHVTLSWLKGHSLLSSISVSDLSISLSLPLEVEDQDTNNYSCVLNNSLTHRTAHLDISAVCHTCGDPPDSMFQIILISAAVAGSLGIFAAVGIIWIYRKRRKTDQEAPTQEDVIYVESVFYRRKVNKPKIKEETAVAYAPIAIRR